jgi:general secretion pathway protein C
MVFALYYFGGLRKDETSIMLIVFQRFHREICLGLLALFGLVCGQLAAVLLERALLVDQTIEFDASQGRETAPSVRKRVDINTIVQQNLFDPASRGRAQSLDQGQRQRPAPRVTDRKDMVLLGTIVSGQNSAALIKIKAEIDLYRPDEEVPGGGIVESIERNRLSIRNQDQTLSIFSLAIEDARPVSQSPVSSNSGILSVGDNRWLVPRTTAEKARKNIAEQLRLAMLEPRIAGGKTEGFVIRQLNPRSLLAAMGMRRGDVVMQVNNMRMDSPEKALQIMQQLREARSISVDIERNRAPMTFHYEIE